MTGFVCCDDHHKVEPLAPYGWRPAGARFDSLTLLAETTWFDGGELRGDTLMQPIVDAMYREAFSEGGSQLMKSRAYYWIFRVLNRDGKVDEARKALSVARNLCDSARNPYDMARIEWSGAPESEIPTAEACNALMQQAEIFKKSGDRVYTGGVLMELGIMLNSIGHPELGLPYLQQADSVFKSGDMTQLSEYNQLNISNAYFQSGDTVVGLELLKELCDVASVKKNPIIYDMVLANLYVNGGDTAALRRAYLNAMHTPGFEPEMAIYEVYLADERLSEGDLGGALWYAGKAMRHSQDLEDPEWRMEYEKLQESLHLAQKHWKEALEARRRADIIKDSLLDVDNRYRIAGLELTRLRDLREVEMREHRVKIYARGIAGGIGAIIIILGVCWLFHSHAMAKKYAALQLSLDLEQANRRNLALQLTMQEKTDAISKLQKQIAGLRDVGEIKSATAGKIEALLRSEIALHGEQEGFLATFSQIRPDFIDRFHAILPDAGDAEVRLAVYTVIGLDTKHIARLCGIRPESVKQARWRLRKRMMVPEGVSLDDALRNICSPS